MNKQTEKLLVNLSWKEPRIWLIEDYNCAALALFSGPPKTWMMWVDLATGWSSWLGRCRLPPSLLLWYAPLLKLPPPSKRVAYLREEELSLVKSTRVAVLPCLKPQTSWGSPCVKRCRVAELPGLQQMRHCLWPCALKNVKADTWM